MRKELKIIKEEELEGDLVQVVDFLINVREKALSKGYTHIELGRYYGDEEGYLSVTGVEAREADSFSQAYWEDSDDAYDEDYLHEEE
jgi:hypothetical protein